MKHIIAYLSYALLSITAGLIIAAELQGTSVFIGFLYAQVLFLSCIVAHEIISSRFWQKTTRWQLKALAHRQTQMEREFRSLRNQTKGILDILTLRRSERGPTYVKQQRLPQRHHNVVPLHPKEESPPLAPADYDWYERQERKKEHDSGEWFNAQEQQKRKKQPENEDFGYKPALVKKDAQQRTQVAFDYDNIISQSHALRYAQDTTLKEIRESLRNKDIRISLQPIVNLKTMGAVHYECFTSILSPNGEAIPPKSYIHKAREAGLLPSIDGIVLTQALEQILADAKKIPSNWRHIFFNISLDTFKTEEIFFKIENFFKANSSFNKRVVFEISYQDCLRNAQLFKPYLKRLHKFGANISFDNVETLSTIKLPLFSTHNIAFIKIGANVMQKELKRTLKDPYHPKNIKRQLDKFGVQLIVEKIENKEQLQMLQELDIGLVQGYVFGFPTPIKEISVDGFPQLEELKMQRAV